MGNKTVVHFHVGRGGKFHNGGYKEFKGVQDLTLPNEYCTIIDTDENGNQLSDDEWILIEDSSEKVLLKGKNNIMSRTGVLDYDGKYDTDIYKYIEDCDEEELRLLHTSIYNNDVETMDLTPDDIEYINEMV